MGISRFVITFSLASVLFRAETALSVSFSVAAAVELSLSMVVVVSLRVFGIFTFVMISVTISVDIGSVSFGGVVTGALIVASVVRSESLSVSVATDLVDASLISTTGAVVVREVVLSVPESLDTLVLASLLTLGFFVVTFMSTLNCSGTDVVISVVAAVLAFLVSTACFSLVAWAAVDKLTSVVIFSMDLVGFPGEMVLSVSFLVLAAVESSSTTAAVVAFAVLETFTFVIALIRGSVEIAFVFLAPVVTGALVVFSVVISIAATILSASVVIDILDSSVVSSPSAGDIRGVVVSANDSVDISVLAAGVTVESSVFTSVSTIISTGAVVIVSVGIAVVAFLVSRTCFSAAAWAAV